MAFPKHLLEKTQGFKTYLGRQGKNLLSMEEVILQQELRQQGYQCIYDPQILVQHHIPKHRLTQRWFLRRAWWNGISAAYEDIYQQTSFHTKSLTIGRHSVKYAISALRWSTMTMIAFTPSSRLERVCFVLERVGYFWGLMHRKL